MQISALISTFLTGDACLVADKCLSHAIQFWSDLLTWMMGYFSQLKTRNESLDKDNWMLVSESVKKIFSMLGNECVS